jgi:hypothetical protein
MVPTRAKDSEFANQGELTPNEAVAAESVSEREDSQGAEPGTMAAGDVRKPIGARPESLVSGRHDEGSDANETEDGLTESEEAMRKAVEDLPTGTTDNPDDIPVFDRGDALPRI